MESGRQESRRLNIAVSSGSGTGTIQQIWALARRLRISPPNESTTYTFSVKDAAGRLILETSGQVGTFSMREELSLGIASTVVISSASVDGEYVCLFDMH